jgi:Fe-S cluster assembly protein SufD
MSASREPSTWFAEQFASFKQARSAQEPEWLGAFRESAMVRFQEAGFPTKRYEEWKYTNVSGLVKSGYSVLREGPGALSSDNLDTVAPALSNQRLVFVDGVYMADLSSVSGLPEGAYAGSLAVALRGEQSDKLHQQLGQLLDSRVENPLTYLNMAMFEDGALVSVPRNKQVDGPIEVVFVSTGSHDATAYHPRNIYHVEQGASVTIVERYVSAEAGASYWQNPATAFFIGDNARIAHVKVQNESLAAQHISQYHVEQGRDSVLDSVLLNWGSELSRHEVETVLGGENIECKLSGLYLANQGQHMDHRIFMEHVKPHCMSDQYFKGILAGNGSGAFSGRIYVNQEAQKTDAYQTHQAMLLSDDASVNSKPQLEIYADDVKCSHGATTGNIDSNALFYLRSRGIPKLQAERMLIQAFAHELIERIADEGLQETLGKALEQQLATLQQ